MLFERGSKLSEIGFGSLDKCRSLRKFCIPGQLEAIDWDLFSDCKLLTELIFEVPSQLKELELPPNEFGRLSIPDSVGVIWVPLRGRPVRTCVLQFGDKSNVKEITFDRDMFFRFSEAQLRRLRSKCESS
jgi:hypothetical protein